MKIAAIGDVHGHLEELEEIIKILKRDHNPDLYVIIGDYVDRGPNSRGVIEFVKSASRKKNFVCLKGNHEDMMIVSAYGLSDPAHWLANGGDKTFSEYGGSDPSLLTPEELKAAMSVLEKDAKFLDDLPVYLVTDKYVFVHGGIPRADMDISTDLAASIMIWHRGAQPKWQERIVVHGHTPVKRVLITDTEINVDTGCGFGLSLSAAVIDTETDEVKVVSVKNERK